MARFQESVYSVSAGGPLISEVSGSGDRTLWVELEPGALARLRWIEPAEEDTGGFVFRLDQRLSAEQSIQLARAIEGLPPGGVFPSQVCDGPGFRLILSLPGRVERCSWGCSGEPQVALLMQFAAMLDEFAAAPQRQ